MQMSLEDCVRRKIRVCVFVQRLIAREPLSEADKVIADSHNAARQILSTLGVHVTDFPNIHAKVAVIDGEIGWDGSLNILSQYKTEERMTRWNSREKVAEIIKSHRLDCCQECCTRPGYCISAKADVSSFIESQQTATGTAIALRRKALGLSQQQLSDISGVSQAHIAKIEKEVRTLNSVLWL